MKTKINIIGFIVILASSFIFAKTANTVVNANLNIRKDTNLIVATVTPTPTPTPTATVTIALQKRIQIKIALKKTNAIKEIDRRLASLNKLTDKINGIKRISSTQRETLLAQIKIEITSLQDLKTKIEAETDATALQEEKKSITESYRIYALLIPKIEIIAHADKIISLADAMSAKTTDEGLKKIIAESKAKAQSAIDLVMPLVPEDYPGFKTTLSTARDMLKDARTNLNTVFATLKGTE
jgi:hypothetical protein